MSSAPESFWQRNKDRFITGAFLLLLAYSVLRNILRAAIHPFWFDELCTLIMAHQPNLAALWSALTGAADSQPPPFYLVEKLAGHIIPNEQIAFRLPSILGFCCMEWCLFVWLKRRHSAAIAFAASLIPFLTPIYTVYATEARGYSLSLAGLCLALVAYQRAPKGRWILLLAFSLAAAQSAHFYSFIMMTPFFAAEAVFALKTKLFRWSVWAALFCGILPLIAFWPMLARIKAYYSEHPWMMHPTLFGTLHIYGWLFGISRAAPGSSYWPFVTWFLLAAGCIVISFLLIYRALRSDPSQEPFFHEGVLIAGFLLLPVVLFVVIKLTHGVLAPRYLLAVTFGFVFAAARGLNYLNPRSVFLIGTLLCASVAILDAEFWFSFYGSYQLGFQQPKPVEQLTAKAGRPDLPIVVADGHDYLETDHYAPPALRQRLTFLADPSAAIAFNRSDFNDKELLALRGFAPIRVFEYAKFKDSRTVFLLYSNPTPENTPDWFVLHLLNDRWSVQKLASDGHNTVYLVEPPRETH